MAPTTHLTGRRVLDQHGEQIGTITDVLSDDRTLEPRWAVVSYGIFNHHRRLVPVSRLYTAARDDERAAPVVSTIDKDIVRHAPKHAGGPLTREVDRLLGDYYGVAA